MNDETRPLLLVEDNEDDIFIFQRAYKHAGLSHPLRVARDGQEALNYLLGQEAFADRTLHPAPFLVLLDLKLPFKSGLEVLQGARARIDGTVVVVLTSSAEMRDVQRARELGAHAYLVKPPNARMLGEILAAVQLWMRAPEPRVAGISGDYFSAPDQRRLELL